MRVNVDLLVYPRWIIPVEPEDQVYEDYALVIDKGRILALLPANQAGEKYQAAETVNLKGHAVIPGLINAHTHASMSLLKGLADDLPLLEWLNNYIWPAETQWVDPQFVADGTRLAAAEMLRSGTTCFNDMYYYPDITAEVVTEIGMRAIVGLIIIDFPTAWAKDPLEYFDKGEKVHDKFRHNPLITTSFAPHAPYTVSEQSLKKIVVLAEEMDIPINTHVHETADEVRQFKEKSGITPLKYLERLGLLSQRLLAVHMTQLDDEDIESIKRYNVNVIHCPESNLKLASGLCPVQALIQSGINVALGTDGSASNNDLNMLGEMRTAAFIGKAASGDPSALPAMTILKMATINAARALDLDQHIGSLLPGKSADMVAIDLSTIETQPLYEPVSQIVYAADRSQVSDVWVEGKHLLKNRELTTMNLDQVLKAARIWGERIKPTPDFVPSEK
jgi:5-methylthioadenosine/S-adenosylhomocysteine deaminase